MKRLLFTVLITFFLSAAMAQDTVSGDDLPATVIVHKDPRFDELAARQIELNKQYYISTPRQVQGYRIQAANTQNRDQANAIKAELLRRFPDQKSYLLYRAPNFRVRIGNFLTQKDAFQLRKLISALYPDHGIYIVPDIIEYTPSIDDENDVER